MWCGGWKGEAECLVTGPGWGIYSLCQCMSVSGCVNSADGIPSGRRFAPLLTQPDTDMGSGQE